MPPWCGTVHRRVCRGAPQGVPRCTRAGVPRCRCAAVQVHPDVLTPCGRCAGCTCTLRCTLHSTRSPGPRRQGATRGHQEAGPLVQAVRSQMVRAGPLHAHMVGDVRDLQAPGPGPGTCKPLDQGQGPTGPRIRVRDLQGPGPGLGTCRPLDKGRGPAGPAPVVQGRPWACRVPDGRSAGGGPRTCGTAARPAACRPPVATPPWLPLVAGACGLSKHTTGRRTAGHAQSTPFRCGR